MGNKHVKAIVIGSGAGGGVVAKELAEAGMSVVLFERGKWYRPSDTRKDDLYNQRNQTLGPAFGPDVKKNPRVFVHDDGREEICTPARGPYSNNAACVGGGTYSYGAMAWRFMPQDFKMRSTYGTLAGSTLEDWPIRYEDLEPFYEKAEWEIGVSGDDSNNPYKGPRNKPLPMPPLAMRQESQILWPAAERMGLHPFFIPMLRNTVPYNNRRGCMRCRWCVGFACECEARSGTQNTVILQALRTGTCEIRAECIVSEIYVNDQGVATGVGYYDENDRFQEQTADLVIVSGGAIESARLLLNSKSSLFPEGLGNNHDWVGRNIQDHHYSGAYGLMDYDMYDDLGPGPEIAICDYNHENEGLIGGAMLCNEFLTLPYQAVNTLPPGTRRWGKEHKDFMRTNFRRTMAVKGPTQEMPTFDARVQVDPKVTDHWGIPVARLSGKGHIHSVEIAQEMAKKAEAWLREAGAIQTWRTYPTKPRFSAFQHQAGTCRMGEDKESSVVNRYCQMHECDNVFVVDSSVHVTNGGFNPALTIMAIAYWASDYMKKNFA